MTELDLQAVEREFRTFPNVLAVIELCREQHKVIDAQAVAIEQLRTGKQRSAAIMRPARCKNCPGTVFFDAEANEWAHSATLSCMCSHGESFAIPKPQQVGEQS